MKNFIVYEIKGNKYYKDGIIVNKSQVEKELKYYQLKKLETLNICRLRNLCSNKISSKSNKDVKQPIELMGELKFPKYFTYSNHKFCIDLINLNTSKQKYCLFIHNKRFGYYNFIFYLDSLDEFYIQDKISSYLKSI